MSAIPQRVVLPQHSSSHRKKNTTDLTLYTDPEAPIKRGDILYIYELDEYDKPIMSTEFKAIADKPYKKRTQLIVSLLSEEEV